MSGADHLLAAALAALSLALVFLRPAVPEGHRRYDLYLSGALSGFAFASVVLLVWHAGGRPLARFGLGGWTLGGAELAAALAWTLLLGGATWAMARGLLRAPLERLYRRYGWLMPRSRRELAASWATSAAAGAGEEIAYRGFLLWYGAALLGPAAGLIGSSLLFGAAHGYQRRFGMAFATLAGLVLGGVYLATHSLPLVIWMHASYNIASFTLGRQLTQGAEAGRAASGFGPAGS